MTIIWLLIAAGVMWSLAMARVALWKWSAVLVVMVLLATIFRLVDVVMLMLAWVVTLAVVIPLNVNSLRRSLISDRILPELRKALPPMSQTEKEALARPLRILQFACD